MRFATGGLMRPEGRCSLEVRGGCIEGLLLDKLQVFIETLDGLLAQVGP